MGHGLGGGLDLGFGRGRRQGRDAVGGARGWAAILWQVGGARKRCGGRKRIGHLTWRGGFRLCFGFGRGRGFGFWGGFGTRRGWCGRRRRFGCD